jgi:hypothetical protein
VAQARVYLGSCEDLMTRGHAQDYRYDPSSGLWQHHDVPAPTPPSFDDLLGADHPTPVTFGEEALPAYLDQARVLLAARPDTIAGGASGLPPELEVLRDFHLPPVCLS